MSRAGGYTASLERALGLVVWSGLENGRGVPAAFRVSFCGVELARQRTSEKRGQRMQTASEVAMCGRAAAGACARGEFPFVRE